MSQALSPSCHTAPLHHAAHALSMLTFALAAEEDLSEIMENGHKGKLRDKNEIVETGFLAAEAFKRKNITRKGVKS